MPRGAFDIFQAGAGFTAVTNPVQRQILHALEQGDRQLPDLVALTGRSKPTLSAIHMKELVQRGLVAELPHATDARRKVYRLQGRRIGSSDVPVEQLRAAVRRYAGGADAVPVGAALLAVAAAPADAPAEVLRAQARHLGAQAGLTDVPDLRALLMAFVALLERQGLAVHRRIDLDRATVVASAGPAVEGLAPARAALLLAAYLEGAAEGAGHAVAVEAAEARARLRFTVRAPA